MISEKKYFFFLGGWIHIHQIEGSVCGTLDKATL